MTQLSNWRRDVGGYVKLLSGLTLRDPFFYCLVLREKSERHSDWLLFILSSSQKVVLNMITFVLGSPIAKNSQLYLKV